MVEKPKQVWFATRLGLSAAASYFLKTIHIQNKTLMKKTGEWLNNSLG